MTLTVKQIKDLESRYGKHNFCYQCGFPGIRPVGEPYSYSNGVAMYCPKCGSSDLDD